MKSIITLNLTYEEVKQKQFDFYSKKMTSPEFHIGKELKKTRRDWLIRWTEGEQKKQGMYNYLTKKEGLQQTTTKLYNTKLTLKVKEDNVFYIGLPSDEFWNDWRKNKRQMKLEGWSCFMMHRSHLVFYNGVSGSSAEWRKNNQKEWCIKKDILIKTN